MTTTTTARTLTEFKRLVKAGMVLLCTDHWQPKYIGTTRTVTKVQTNGYRFSMEGRDERFWSAYPPAREFSTEGDSYRFGTGEKFWIMTIQQ